MGVEIKGMKGSSPPVWAIKMGNWVELRKGRQPKLKTSRAIIKVKHREPFGHQRAVRNTQGEIIRFERGHRLVERETLLTNKVWVGGVPFGWVPYSRFRRKGGVLQPDVVKEVADKAAESYLKEFAGKTQS